MTMPGDGDVLSHPEGFSSKTVDELLTEALAQTDELAQLVGGEWLDSGVPPSVFTPDDRSGWALGACDMPATAEQYSIFVQQLTDPETFDPDAITEKVRAHWKNLGYEVRQLGPVSTDETRLRSIFVDLPYKAHLSFGASTTNMRIQVSSECVKIDY
ncbi:hypothetical protein ACI2IX_14550 [Leifsonia aquatica]|uniref:hypothetical protein n=1 Tax=Leifsonia aquatica TaxID=144185 RepID=UPI003850E1AE